MGMYDALGKFLNDALEKGQLPPVTPEFSDEKTQNEYKENLNNIKPQQKFTSIKKEEDTNLHSLPLSIKNAFIALDSIPEDGFENIRKKYRNMLKENHPDTKNQNKDEINISLDVHKIVEAFEIIQKYYNQ